MITLITMMFVALIGLLLWQHTMQPAAEPVRVSIPHRRDRHG
jgi:hypothetical protein